MGNLVTINYSTKGSSLQLLENENYIYEEKISDEKISEDGNMEISKEIMLFSDFKPIKDEYAYKIKEILKICQLDKEINLDILSNKIVIKYIEKPVAVGENGYSCALVKEKLDATFESNSSLDATNASNCLIEKFEEPELCLGVFDFNKDSRIKNVTMYLQRWGSVMEFLDLSDAVENDEYIYILKNISNAKQCGAICKLYRNVKNQNVIIKRQEDLIKKLNCEVLEHNDGHYIVVSKIKVQDLKDENRHKEVLHSLLEDFIRYAFTVDFISKGY